MAKSAMSAWLMKCLVPFSTQSSPSWHGGRLHAAQVGAGAGLGHGEAVRLLAADAGRRGISRAARACRRSRMFEGRADAGPVQRVVGAAELLLVEQPGQRIEAGAADILRHVGGVEAGGDRLGLELFDQLAAQVRRCARPRPRAGRARSRRRRGWSRRSAAALPTGRNPWAHLGWPTARPSPSGRAARVQAAISATSGPGSLAARVASETWISMCSPCEQAAVASSVEERTLAGPR